MASTEEVSNIVEENSVEAVEEVEGKPAQVEADSPSAEDSSTQANTVAYQESLPSDDVKLDATEANNIEEGGVSAEAAEVDTVEDGKEEEGEESGEKEPDNNVESGDNEEVQEPSVNSEDKDVEENNATEKDGDAAEVEETSHKEEVVEEETVDATDYDNEEAEADAQEPSKAAGESEEEDGNKLEIDDEGAKASEEEKDEEEAKASDEDKGDKDEDEDKDEEEEKKESDGEVEEESKEDDLTKEIFGDSDEDDQLDVPEPVDYNEESDEDEAVEPAKKLKRLAKNSKRKKRATEDEGEEGYEEEKPKKKRKSKKKEDGETPTKKKRKNKQQTTESGDESDPERSSRPSQESEVPELDAALERIKKKRPKQMNDEAIAPLVTALIEKMESAYNADLKANQERQPAIGKMRILSQVAEALNKRPFVLNFLENKGLHQIKNWLSPMPDKSLPNVKLREQLLAILSAMPINTEHLEDSKLGHVVMFLLKNPMETRENKRVCSTLIEKWSRPIFNLSSRYEDLEHMEQARNYKRKQIDETETPLDRLTRESTKDTRRHHASIPQRLAMDYTVRPNAKEHLKSDTAVVKNKLVLAERADKRIKQKLSKGKNPVGRKVLRAEKMSVEGRGYK